MFYHLNCSVSITLLHVTCYPLSGSALDHNVNWRIRFSGRLLCNIEPSCSINRQLTLHQSQIYTLLKTRGITSGCLITCVEL